MYNELFQLIFGFASFTGNFFLDSLIVTLLSAALHSGVFAIVGHLYASGIIEGSRAGKLVYGVLFIGTIVGVVYLIDWLRTNWWVLIIIGVVAIAIAIIAVFLVLKHNMKRSVVVNKYHEV